MMQIFMPYPDVNINAKILDDQTLGKQCNSVPAILEALRRSEHLGMWNPAIKMWKGNEQFLGFYGHRLIAEWKAMGYPDLWSARLTEMGYFKTPSTAVYPWWWGHEAFHDYNKAALFRQNPDWYGRFFTDIELDTIGWWPNLERGKFIRGPKTLVGDFMINEHPVFDGVRMMADDVFIEHANKYHKLTPDIQGGIRHNENPQLLNLLRTLHDRFHVQRVYQSHDHR
jgi:hypothetical protein